MFQADVIYLIHQSRNVDEYGDPVIVETQRMVFCEVASIGQKEFYQAQAVGLQPEIKFVLSDYLDYDGEMYLIHNGIRYKVLRTYRKDETLELTCYREVQK